MKLQTKDNISKCRSAKADKARVLSSESISTFIAKKMGKPDITIGKLCDFTEVLNKYRKTHRR